MKKRLQTFLIIIIGLFVSCSRSELKEGTPLKPNTELAKILTSEVGDPIPVNLAASWIKAFQNEAKSPNITLTHDMSRATLEKLLSVRYAGLSVDGLRFIKGINNKGEELLMVIPVLGGNDLWYLSYPDSEDRANDQGTVYDKNGPVTIALARQLVDRFKINNPSNEIHRSYFVGRQALQEMISAKYQGKPVECLRFYKAYNDGNKETFIIAPVQNGETLGPLELLINAPILKGSAAQSEVVYYEYSSPCPSSC